MLGNWPNLIYNLIICIPGVNEHQCKHCAMTCKWYPFIICESKQTLHEPALLSSHYLTCVWIHRAAFMFSSLSLFSCMSVLSWKSILCTVCWAKEQHRPRMRQHARSMRSIRCKNWSGAFVWPFLHITSRLTLDFFRVIPVTDDIWVDIFSCTDQDI